MVVLGNMIELGQVRNGLVVSGETAEELLETTMKSLLSDTTLTRKSIKPAFASLTIGSGSMGLFMRRAEEDEKKPRLVCGAWQANTVHSDLCHGGKSGVNATLMATNSEELLTRGVETALLTWKKFSGSPGWQREDIDHFFLSPGWISPCKAPF